MATINPVGRINYEPNSWDGPREDPERGFGSFVADEGGAKRRVRAELFADHYSQAKQFYDSQTRVEQKHIVDAFVFELSKVERSDIRARMVGNLRNVDEHFAQSVADGLGLELPDASEPARPRVEGLAPSQALSIVANTPDTFEGRKVGVLVSDGADAGILGALDGALSEEGATFEIIAPAVGGVRLSDGQRLPADQKYGGGPSVLYDAVVLLTSADEAATVSEDPAVRDFVADAFAHCKFIGYIPTAEPLLEAAGVARRRDDGVIELASAGDVGGFVDQCRMLRFWERELSTVTVG
jgi:catalase